MKTLIFFFILFLFSTSISSKDAQADSLKILFVHAKTQQERMERCLNLDNYYRNILFRDSVVLTQTLLEEGIKTRNEYIITDALRKLVMGINRKKRVLTNDSVIHYLKIADEVLTGERKRSFITEIHLRHIRSIADWTKDESQIIEELTTKYNNSNINSDDVYFQIERNYALGMAAALGISDYNADVYKNSLRYFEQLVELIDKVPIQYGAEILFWVNENIYLGYLNSDNKEKAIEFLEKMMNTLKRYKELPEVKADVYQNFEFVCSFYYEGIARFPKIVGYKKAFDSLKKADMMLRKRNDLISLYFAYKEFYENTEDYKNIILYSDSIIEFMKTYDSPVAKSVTSSMYEDQANCYASLKDYKRAYERMQTYNKLQGEITNEDSKKLRADMDARYDLNQLELEKERLTSRNQQIIIFSTLFVFALSIAWGVSQRYHLHKLRLMQKELVESNKKLIESNKEVIKQSEKAQESEKMKTAFINSMCHEIRTPLNAINGFSSLLLDQSIDAACKEEFPDLIQKNTDLLTGLLDDLIEVSNLSSSAEELPREEADIRNICTQEMEKVEHLHGKSSIHYQLDIDENCCSIHTNALYLSQAIAHLLHNANKFTEEGQITLGCHRNAAGQLIINVTDTGIGIPIDKQEWVFERFAKIDDFKPGTGLGLYICQLIVKRLGGTIHINPEYTQGANFVITLSA